VAGARTFVVRFVSDTDKALDGFKKLNNGLAGVGNSGTIVGRSFKDMFTGAAVATAGVSAAVVGVAGALYKATQAAAEDQKSQALLADQLQKTVGASDSLVASTERLIAEQQALTGISDTDLRDALSILVRGTGDLTKAQNLLSTAMDISTATGKDLNSVSIALARGANGQFTALTRLGIPIDENTKKSKDFNQVLRDLNDQFGGAAKTAAGTFQGQLKILQGQFGEIVETVGAALLPYLQQFSDFIVTNVVPAVQRITTVLGEKGLVAAFQQLVYESGKSAPALIGAFRAITIGVAEFVNVTARAFNVTKAQFQLLRGDVVGAVKSFAAATKEVIDTDALRSAFDSLAVGINHYKREVTTADRAERQLNATGEATIDTFGEGGGGGKGGVAKTVKTAAEKLKMLTEAIDKSTAASKRLKSAGESVADSQKSLADATSEREKAQAAFNQAVAGYGADSEQAKDAQRKLDAAQRDVARSGFRVEQAVFAVKDAEKELAEVRKDPESTPQKIREAEIRLAEAKLAVTDATDAQYEATKDLGEAQRFLNEQVSGAIPGSAIYEELASELADAKEREADMTKRVAEAIDAQREALDEYNKSLQTQLDISKQFPKVAAGVPNPFASEVASIQQTQSAARAGIVAAPTVDITVNAGLGASGEVVGAEIAEYLRQYATISGIQFSNGSTGALFGR
jgi:tetratricopeptide (TPR) repeat protein